MSQNILLKCIALFSADHLLSADLTSLQLSNARVSSSTLKPLVNLQRLNLLGVHISPSVPLRLFDPTRLPSLTCLACYQAQFEDGSLSDMLEPLLQQLDVVSLDASTIRNLPDPLLVRLRNITLFDHDDLIKIPLVPFIRLHNSPD